MYILKAQPPYCRLTMADKKGSGKPNELTKTRFVVGKDFKMKEVKVTSYEGKSDSFMKVMHVGRKFPEMEEGIKVILCMPNAGGYTFRVGDIFSRKDKEIKVKFTEDSSEEKVETFHIPKGRFVFGKIDAETGRFSVLEKWSPSKNYSADYTPKFS